MGEKTVLDHRNEIIELLKYFPLSEKKWLIKRFWDGIETAVPSEDKSKISRKLPLKFINDQKGQILYMSMKFMMDRHIDALLKEKYPSNKIN